MAREFLDHRQIALSANASSQVAPVMEQAADERMDVTPRPLGADTAMALPVIECPTRLMTEMPRRMVRLIPVARQANRRADGWLGAG